MFVRLLIDSYDLCGIKVIWWPLSTSDFGAFWIYFQIFRSMTPASFYQFLLYFGRQAVLVYEYSKGMV